MQFLTAANKHTKGLVPIPFKSREKRNTITGLGISRSSFCSAIFLIYCSFSTAALLAEAVFLRRIVRERWRRQAKANLTDEKIKF